MSKIRNLLNELVKNEEVIKNTASKMLTKIENME